ncbi:hypothetical protein EUBSIR_01347 [[Eubacterium] siraeum DSM 15702]|uniref:Uncharacterized protein n=2 Tax=root TaxID=1 RepID=B0MND6_9FIRM|nr:hypothetical protein EUBSIR_01347 [[Eubacterium] siraeum DSM 15702]
MITFSIDVEPFIDSVPLSSSVAVDDASEDVPATLLVAVWEQPVAAATKAAPAISDINFLFMLFPFLRAIPLGVFLILHNVYVHFYLPFGFPPDYISYYSHNGLYIKARNGIKSVKFL